MEIKNMNEIQESYSNPGQGNTGEQCPFCHYQTEPGTSVCRGCGAKRKVEPCILWKISLVITPILSGIFGLILTLGYGVKPFKCFLIMMGLIALVFISAFFVPKKVLWRR